MTAGVDLGQLAAAVPVTVNIALLPTYCTLWNRITMVSPHLHM